jgi:hypothetical protein
MTPPCTVPIKLASFGCMTRERTTFEALTGFPRMQSPPLLNREDAMT